jgi:hypothetical protein
MTQQNNAQVCKVTDFLAFKTSTPELVEALHDAAIRTYWQRYFESDCQYPELDDDELKAYVENLNFSKGEDGEYSFELYDEGFVVKLTFLD